MTAFGLFRGGRFLLAEATGVHKENHRHSIVKVLFNQGLSRVNPHEQGSDSQPQC